VKIFIVNLEQSVSRKAFMKKQLETIGLQHEFFSAVDGRQLTPAQLEQMCNMEVVNNWAELLTPGMIGCSLSHYHLYKKMVDENIKFALILEDDTRLSPQLPKVLYEIEEKLSNGKLNVDEPILLYYQSKDVVQFARTGSVSLPIGSGLYYPIDIWRPITTAAYIISYACAKRLINLIYPIRYSPDSWAVYHREGAIAGLRCVLPLPVESGYFKSDIGYEQDKIVNNFIKYLESKNIFPIIQLLKWRRRVRAKEQNRFEIIDQSPNWQQKSITNTTDIH
jgi:glycosyl transferase, family 25